MSKLLNFHPILFQPEMVAANLDGRKTETRRIINPQPKGGLDCFGWKLPEYTHVAFGKETRIESLHKCPCGQPGDILWVRENFAKVSDNYFIYQANEHQQSMRWKPSIHMPKEACRMFLLLKEVKVERLQDITEESAIAEGVEKHNTLPGYKNYNLGDINDNEYFRSPKDSFKSLIQKIHGEEIWQQNPWLWVLKYEVLSTTGIEDLRKNARTLCLSDWQSIDDSIDAFLTPKVTMKKVVK